MSGEVKGEAAKHDDAVNTDLQRTHRELVALVRRLERRSDDVSSPEEAAAVADAVVEANTRVNAISALLFACETEEISAAAAEVSGRMPEIEEAIGDVERLKALTNGVAALLGTVDRAIGLAREACT